MQLVIFQLNLSLLHQGHTLHGHFSMQSIIITHHFIYLFLKFSPLNNSSKFLFPNLIFNLKNSTIHIHSFKHYFCYYYYYSIFIYLFLLKIQIIKFQFFKSLTFEFNFRSKKFHYSRSFF